MGKIFCLMGKSSSGKDTIYKMLLDNRDFPLRKIVLYTTRPIRMDEKEGIEYHFTDEEGLAGLERQGRVIELRAYHTMHGIWKYFTVDDGQVNFHSGNYLVIGTLESYGRLLEYYGKDHVLPIYIQIDDGVRLQRALDRERMQDVPKYAEMCRRFLADADDFSEEKILQLGIEKRFENQDLRETVDNILQYMKAQTRL